mgnify:CR=1 FL=1
MYFLYTVIFLCILYYFWAAIKEAVLYYSKLDNYYLNIGNPWFYVLLLINILILWFVYSFYQEKIGPNSAGTIGPNGYRGVPGNPGEECKICLD